MTGVRTFFSDVVMFPPVDEAGAVGQSMQEPTPSSTPVSTTPVNPSPTQVNAAIREVDADIAEASALLEKAARPEVRGALLKLIETLRTRKATMVVCSIIHIFCTYRFQPPPIQPAPRPAEQPVKLYHDLKDFAWEQEGGFVKSVAAFYGTPTRPHTPTPVTRQYLP